MTQINSPIIGLNMDNIASQRKEGQLTMAMNATIESFDGQSISYGNEQQNELCVTLPIGYKLIHQKHLFEINRVLYWITNPSTGYSQIGYTDNGDCTYNVLIDDSVEGSDLFNFSIDYPIRKSVSKSTNCSVQVYWTDNFNPRRYIDFDNLPWKEQINPNNDFQPIKLVGKLDANKLLVQPNFSVPEITPKEVNTGGSLVMGTYQFAIQYANSLGEGYTSYYGVTNPIGIFENKTSPDFNLPTSKSININIDGLDTSGLYDYYNLAVIENINNISTAKLIQTLPISGRTASYTYTGTTKTDIRLDIIEIFEKFPYYDLANDVFSVDNVIGWDQLKADEQINYQPIWSKVKLNWETYKIPYSSTEAYNNGINTALYRGYMRDEVYAFEGCFILKNGKQTDSFHIPGREATSFDRDIISNKDALTTKNECEIPESKQRWQVYNTGSLTGFTQEYLDYINNNDPTCIEIANPIGNIVSGRITFTPYDQGPGQDFNTIKIELDNSYGVDVFVQLGFLALNTDGNYRAGGQSLIDNVPSSPAILPATSNPWIVTIPAGNTEVTVIADGTQGYWGNIPWAYFPDSANHYTDIYIKTPCSNADFTVFVDQAEPYEVHNLTDNCGEPEVICIPDKCYIGPYEYGEMGYWESDERYPNNPVIWGDLANQKIRHSKFPDCLITNIHDNNLTGERSWEHSIYPIGVTIDANSLHDAISNSNLTQEQKDNIVGFKILRANRVDNKSVISKGILNNVGKYNYKNQTRYYANYPYNSVEADPFFASSKIENHSGYNSGKALNGFTEESKNRFAFHSPDTHFYQPSIGNQGEFLKLETIEYGNSFGHFVQVKDNAQYKFLTRNTIQAAAGLGRASGLVIGAGQFGWPEFMMSAVIPTYTSAVELFEKLTPYTNFGYGYYSVGLYNKSYKIPNDGFKVRNIDFNKYIIDGDNSIESGNTINNFRRESSVYIHTTDTFKYTHEYDQSIYKDNSRYRPSGELNRIETKNISTYYGAIKRYLPQQYGRIYSYETIDTGFYQELKTLENKQITRFPTVFGGDIFINRFALKQKLSLFRDTTVGQKYANQTDIAYDELGSLGYPMFWLSTKPVRFDINLQPELDDFLSQLNEDDFLKILGNIATGGALGAKEAMDLLVKVFKEIYDKLGIKNVNFDRASIMGLAEQGIMYLYSYGIPYYFCESEVNVDFRQAYNEREGNFYPNIGGDIPDDWLQESNVPIIYDNTYTYNQTYSKQNKENFFTHLREDYDPNKKCYTEFPNRAIWSDKSSLEETKNNWLVYRAAARYDLPKEYGQLISIDNIENNQLLVRFQNKSQLYNALTTVQVSQGAPAYLGNSKLFSGSPALDLSETDSGYGGSQNVFLLRTEYGHIYIDSKRGQIISLKNGSIDDLANKAMDKWFSENLPFKILNYFPDIDIDNNYKDIGLHGIYDPFYERLIITKLDYEPIVDGIFYENGKFYINDVIGKTPSDSPKNDPFRAIGFVVGKPSIKQVFINDPNYFCNKSWTLSYSFKTQSWTSFHSYRPNYYISYGNYFQSGRNDIENIWNHNRSFTGFNNFYGTSYPYIIEYPFVYKTEDEILQSVKEYCTVRKYINFDTWYEPDEIIYFTKSIIYNDQQCTGALNLIPKSKNNLSLYRKYPIIKIDSKDVLVDKKDNNYQYNTFWSITKDLSKPIFESTCKFEIEEKQLNQDNLDYSNRDFKKAPMRARETKIRHFLERNDYKIVNKFLLAESVKSYI